MNEGQFRALLLQHLKHARDKHPDFVRVLDSRKPESIQAKLKQYRHLYESRHTAYYALVEEVEEIFEALSNGDRAGAIRECFDAIAVLVRLILKLEESNNENSINR